MITHAGLEANGKSYVVASTENCQPIASDIPGDKWDAAARLRADESTPSSNENRSARGTNAANPEVPDFTNPEVCDFTAAVTESGHGITSVRERSNAPATGNPSPERGGTSIAGTRGSAADEYWQVAEQTMAEDCATWTPREPDTCTCSGKAGAWFGDGHAEEAAERAPRNGAASAEREGWQAGVYERIRSYLR